MILKKRTIQKKIMHLCTKHEIGTCLEADEQDKNGLLGWINLAGWELDKFLPLLSVLVCCLFQQHVHPNRISVWRLAWCKPVTRVSIFPPPSLSPFLSAICSAPLWIRPHPLFSSPSRAEGCSQPLPVARKQLNAVPYDWNSWLIHHSSGGAWCIGCLLAHRVYPE